MAVNILKVTLNSKGNWINSPESLGTITLDTDIEISEIGDYLPNNTDKYDKEFQMIPSGSTVKLLMPNKWYLCMFNAELGTPNADGLMSGIWRSMANVKFL